MSETSSSRVVTWSVRLLSALVLVMLIGAGCSDESPSNNNAGTADASDTGGDVSDTSDEDVEDTGPDDTSGDDAGDGTTADAADATTSDTITQPDGCKDVGALETTIALDENGPVGQYYARAAFDGEGVWVVYTRKEVDSDDEDIFAGRILCDGTIDVEPTKINTTGDGVRDYAPSVDVRAGIVHFVWTTDLESDLGVGYRSFTVDGSPSLNESVDVTPQTDAGEPISQLIWEVDIAGLPDGGAVIVASYGDGENFRVFAQQIDQTGSRAGSHIDVHTMSPQPDQYTPMVAVRSEQRVWISWNSSMGENLTNSTVYRTLDLTDPQPAEPSSLDPHEGFVSQGVPAPFAEPLPEEGVAFLAYTTAEYRVKLAAIGDADASDVFTGTNASTPNLRPGLAAGLNGGVVAWYSGDPSPVQNQVKIQPFGHNPTDGSVLGTPSTIPTASAQDYARAPYGPSVVHVGNGAYFVVWNEGPATNEAKVVGRFIQP